jgi:putative toxin-antitoxin system antitoxin component (TIGR02293 family)
MDEITLFRKRLDKEITPILKQTCKSIAVSKYKVVLNSCSYNDFLLNTHLVMSVIRHGIPYSLFDVIRTYAPFTENDWAEYLNVSTKTLQRFESEEKDLKPILSEKVIELSELMLSGLNTFGSLEKFELWLKTPNFALGNIQPFELMKDSYGKDLLLGELNRINHGILA